MKKTFLCLVFVTGCLSLWRAEAQTVTQEQCQQEASSIVDQLIKTEVARDIDSQIKLFAPEVTQDGKSIKKEQLRKENLNYYKRWPIAQWSLLKPVEIRQLTHDSFEAIYEASFRVESPERGKWSGGKLKSTLKLVQIDGKYLIQGTEDHISESIKGELQKGSQLAESQSASVIDKCSNDPVAVYQTGLTAKPTVTKTDKRGIYQVFANPTEWCLVDKSSGVIIARESLKNVASPFGDVIFSPDSKKIAFLLGGNRGDPSMKVVSISDPLNEKIVEMGESRNLDDQILRFSAEGMLPTVKWLRKNGGATEEALQYNRTLLNISFPKDKIDHRHITFEDRGRLFITKSSGARVVMYDISSFRKLLEVSGSDFYIDSSTHQIIISGKNNIYCYNYLNNIKQWELPISLGNLPFVFSKGILYTAAPENNIQAREVSSGKLLWDKSVPQETNQKISRFVVSPDGRFLSVAVGLMSAGQVFVLNTIDGSIVYNADSDGRMAFSADSMFFAHSVYAGFGSVNATVVSTTDWKTVSAIHEEPKTATYGIQDMCFDKNTPQLLYSLQSVDSLRSSPLDQHSSPRPIVQEKLRLSDLSFALSNNLLLASDADGFCNYWSIPENSLRLKALIDESGSPLLITPDGFYLSSGSALKSVGFRFNARGYPLEQFDLRLNRPDIVLERLGAPKEAIETAKSLRDKRLKRMGVTEEMLQPDFHLPELQIVGDVPAATSKDQLDLKIKATDDKYPLDRLRVYVNNVPVNGRDGELLRDQKTQSLEKTVPIKLAAGRNKIQVSVLNSAGAESLYANAEVTCTAERPKPKLYAVALGVSQYDRPEWCLKYAAKDATDLINKIKEKAGTSYSEVKPLLLTDKEVTKESTAKIKEFLSGATIDDTVLVFMAGHGILDDKYDYYFGTTDIDPANPSERGMPYEAIDTILAEVPSLKKALLMDTCHAGELDDDEKKELAASDGAAAPAAIPTAATNSSPLAGKVAMRSIGTRGMSVKAVQGAKGKSDWYEKLQDMFVDLRRGSGATVISSSQGAEYAFESSEQSNGLFTYALMEALDGKASPNKDGQITISTVGDYVKKRVQDLTKGKQNPNLRGVNLEEDFALSSAK